MIVVPPQQGVLTRVVGVLLRHEGLQGQKVAAGLEDVVDLALVVAPV